MIVVPHDEKRFVLYTQHSDFKDFASAFANWKTYFDNNRSNFYMFMDLLDNTKNFSDVRKCEQLIQVIEGLYKAQNQNDVEITDAHFDLFDCTKNQKSKYLKNGKNTDLLFAKLVKILMEEKSEHFKPDFERIYQRYDETILVRFIKAAKDIRNFYSHGAVNGKLDTLHPYYINAILLKAVRLVLLQDIIGIKDVIIELEDL